MKLELSMSQRLEQRLAPQIIQSIEILQLSTLDLQELIKKELAENEALEEVSESPASAEEAAAPPAAGEKTAESKEREVEFETLERLDEWNEAYSPGPRRHADAEKDRKLEAMQNTASKPESLQDHLFRQFSLVEIDDTEVRTAGKQIIYNIDANGYLEYDLEDIVASMENPVSLDAARRALEFVQELDPRGTGASSARECLILQLDPKEPRYLLKRRLLENHLEDIRKNKLPKIAKETGETLDVIKEMVRAIGRLDLTPGAQFDQEAPHYIHPDVIVEWVDGRYEVRLEDSYAPTLRVSPYVRRTYENKELEPSVREYLKKKMDSAKWLIESIQQRQSTLYKVACEIVRYQRDFLDFGIHHLRPLKMERIADTVGIHVSTVSRAIADKYIQTHRGIFPMKFFFSGATESSSGGAESRVSVKKRVEEIISREDRSKPLSDEDIAEKLTREFGLAIARRTVTKYRKALKIPSSRQRREY